jgi:hypothetical protein
MGKILLMKRGETTAHLPMLQFNHISILPEEKDYV